MWPQREQSETQPAKRSYDGVSRAHINTLLADAAAAGFLRREASDLIVFEPVLSAALERLFAHSFQLMRAAAAAG